jgi:hypothetical protein
MKGLYFSPHSIPVLTLVKQNKPVQAYNPFKITYHTENYILTKIDLPKQAESLKSSY